MRTFKFSLVVLFTVSVLGVVSFPIEWLKYPVVISTSLVNHLFHLRLGRDFAVTDRPVGLWFYIVLTSFFAQSFMLPRSVALLSTINMESNPA